jgi:hypothetical protein
MVGSGTTFFLFGAGNRKKLMLLVQGCCCILINYDYSTVQNTAIVNCIVFCPNDHNCMLAGNVAWTEICQAFLVALSLVVARFLYIASV